MVPAAPPAGGRRRPGVSAAAPLPRPGPRASAAAGPRATWRGAPAGGRPRGPRRPEPPWRALLARPTEAPRRRARGAAGWGRAAAGPAHQRGAVGSREPEVGAARQATPGTEKRGAGCRTPEAVALEVRLRVAALAQTGQPGDVVAAAEEQQQPSRAPAASEPGLPPGPGRGGRAGGARRGGRRGLPKERSRRRLSGLPVTVGPAPAGAPQHAPLPSPSAPGPSGGQMGALLAPLAPLPRRRRGRRVGHARRGASLVGREPPPPLR